MPEYVNGKTCLVTGASSGIGYELALAMAKKGARLIGTGRDSSRCERAMAGIIKESGNRDIEFLIADLSSLEATRALAESVKAKYGSVSVLVHNAGGYTSARKTNAEGIEYQFALNYLAGFHLSALLYPSLVSAHGAKLIMVGSGSHYAGRMHWTDLQMERGYFGLSAYCQSKLALALFIREFARRAPPDSGIVACAADPGLVSTEIGQKGTDSLTKIFWALWSRRGIPASESAAGIEALAEAQGIPTGMYWVKGKAVPASRRSRNAQDSARLWEISRGLCGIDFLSN